MLKFGYDNLVKFRNDRKAGLIPGTKQFVKRSREERRTDHY